MFLCRGDVLFEKYRILEVAGAGFSGIVYKTEHIRLKELRAVKCIEKNQPYYSQLAKEVLILKNLKHPAIPIVYDIEEDDEYLYLIEEYIAGASLQKLISKKESFPLEKVIQYGIQLCDVMQYLHTCFEEPILYLDLKPSNILIMDDKIRLIDFGSCRIQGEHEDKPLVSGTIGFGAPEQFEAVSESKKSDIYGIGAVLYYMITGKRVDGSLMAELSKAQMPKELKKLVGSCLNTNIQKRPVSAGDLAKQLSRLNEKKRYFDLAACLWNKKNEQDSRILGVIGTNPGAGVTSYVLSQGIQYQRQGKKVALVEYNSHNDFGKLKLNDNRKKQREREHQRHHERIFDRKKGYVTFALNGMDYYPACSMETLIMLQNMNYDSIIIDFGCDLESNWEEFMRCEEKRVLLHADVWHMEQTTAFLDQAGKERGSRRWNYLSLFYEESNLMQLEAAYGIIIHTLTLGKEPKTRRKWYKWRDGS